MTAPPHLSTAKALAGGSAFGRRHRPISGDSAPSAFLSAGLLLLASLAPLSGTGFAQATPAAVASPISTGFRLPSVQGSLTYGFSVYGSTSTSAALAGGTYPGTYYGAGYTGHIAFITSSQTHPFSMVASAGESFGASGQTTTPYYSVAFSQVLNTRAWHFVLTDAPSYLPETPTSGLSGVPGTGDLGIAPIQVGTAGQGVLSNYATRVSNATSLSASRTLTGRTSFQMQGTYAATYFVGNSYGGLNNDTASISGGLNHSISGRSSLSASYAYSESFYGAGQPGFISQTATASFSHQISARLSFSLSAGPQWTSYTNTAPATTATLGAYGSASIGYSAGITHYSLSYSQGTNSGYGVSEGARSESVTLSVARPFARVWSGSVYAAYTQSTSLAGNSTPFKAKTEVGGAQVSRALGRSLSFFASYTLEDQPETGSPAGGIIFSGVNRVASIGVGYSPRSVNIGHR
jgi:hypothetical protein